MQDQLIVTFELYTSPGFPGYETISTHDAGMALVDRQLVDRPGVPDDRLQAAVWALGNVHPCMGLAPVPALDAAGLLALLEASPTGCAQVPCEAGPAPG